MAGLAHAAACFGLLALGMVTGWIDFTPDALNRVPVYYFAVTCMTLCLGLVMNSLENALNRADQLATESQDLNRQLANALSHERDARAQAEDSISELQSVQAELEASIDELQIARAELESKTRKQQEIFAIIGHELQTPAAAIELIANDQDDLAAQQPLLARTSKQLLKVLEDMREIVRPGASRPVQLEKTHLPTLMNAVETQVQTLLATSNMALDVHFDGARDLANESVWSDVSRLQAILINTLRNACLHSNGTRIAIHLIGREDELEIRVDDDGRGIPASMHARLLQPWERGDSQGPGTGLGLSVIQRAAQELGGRIQLGDSSLGGASIRVQIPWMSPVAKVTHDVLTAGRIQALMAQWQMVMIDDDEIMRHLIRREYQSLFASVQLFDKAKLAVEPLMENHPDLLICDHFMPEMNGVELIKLLRQNGYQGVIIGATGAVLFEGTHPMLEAGADALIIKPMTQPVLVETLAELLTKGVLKPPRIPA